jgi:SAM-dependent methyltransferase
VHQLCARAKLARRNTVSEFLAAGAEVRAIEVEPANAAALRKIAARTERRGDGARLSVSEMTFEDFHAFAPPSGELFDPVVMNPPFSDNRDIRHIRAAWDHLAPGGRLVAVCSEGPFFRQDRGAAEFRGWRNSIDSSLAKLLPGSAPAPTIDGPGGVVAVRCQTTQLRRSVIHPCDYDR